MSLTGNLVAYPRAEGKVSFLFAVNIGMAGVIAANFPISIAFTLGAVPAWVCLVLLAISTFRIFGAFFPHLNGASHTSMIYFGDIASMPSDNFTSAYVEQSDADVTRDAVCQIWRNSEILKLKFERTKFAFQTTALALLPWLLALSIAGRVTGKIPTFHAG